MNNINSGGAGGHQIPLPPLAVRQEIMERVASGRAEIANGRQRADHPARDIGADLEVLILGTKRVSEF